MKELDPVAQVALILLVLFFLLAMLPGDVGCSASTSSPTVVRLWAETCGEVGR